MAILLCLNITTIMHADKIVTMQEGRIVEVGSHSELLAKHGLYYHLYKAQFEHAFSMDNPFTEEADGSREDRLVLAGT